MTRRQRSKRTTCQDDRKCPTDGKNISVCSSKISKKKLKNDNKNSCETITTAQLKQFLPYNTDTSNATDSMDHSFLSSGDFDCQTTTKYSPPNKVTLLDLADAAATMEKRPEHPVSMENRPEQLVSTENRTEHPVTAENWTEQPVSAEKGTEYQVSADNRTEHPVSTEKRTEHLADITENPTEHQISEENRTEHLISIENCWTEHPVIAENRTEHLVSMEKWKEHPISAEKQTEHPVSTENQKEYLVSAENGREHLVSAENGTEQLVSMENWKEHLVSTEKQTEHPVSAENLKEYLVSAEKPQENPVSMEKQPEQQANNLAEFFSSWHTPYTNNQWQNPPNDVGAMTTIVYQNDISNSMEPLSEAKDEERSETPQCFVRASEAPVMREIGLAMTLLDDLTGMENRSSDVYHAEVHDVNCEHGTNHFRELTYEAYEHINTSNTEQEGKEVYTEEWQTYEKGEPTQELHGESQYGLMNAESETGDRKEEVATLITDTCGNVLLSFNGDIPMEELLKSLAGFELESSNNHVSDDGAGNEVCSDNVHYTDLHAPQQLISQDQDMYSYTNVANVHGQFSVSQDVTDIEIQNLNDVSVNRTDGDNGDFSQLSALDEISVDDLLGGNLRHLRSQSQTDLYRQSMTHNASAVKSHQYGQTYYSNLPKAQTRDTRTVAAERLRNLLKLPPETPIVNNNNNNNNNKKSNNNNNNNNCNIKSNNKSNNNKNPPCSIVLPRPEIRVPMYIQNKLRALQRSNRVRVEPRSRLIPLRLTRVQVPNQTVIETTNEPNTGAFTTTTETLAVSTDAIETAINELNSETAVIETNVDDSIPAADTTASSAAELSQEDEAAEVDKEEPEDSTLTSKKRLKKNESRTRHSYAKAIRSLKRQTPLEEALENDKTAKTDSVDQLSISIATEDSETSTYASQEDGDKMADTQTVYNGASTDTYKNRNGKVKRPMNAFMVWSCAVRARVAASMRSPTNAQVSVILGDIWRRMSDANKRVYYEEATRIKMRHSQMFPDWIYKPEARPKKISETKVKSRYWQNFCRFGNVEGYRIHTIPASGGPTPRTGMSSNSELSDTMLIVPNMNSQDEASQESLSSSQNDYDRTFSQSQPTETFNIGQVYGSVVAHPSLMAPQPGYVFGKSSGSIGPGAGSSPGPASFNGPSGLSEITHSHELPLKAEYFIAGVDENEGGSNMSKVFMTTHGLNSKNSGQAMYNVMTEQRFGRGEGQGHADYEIASLDASTAENAAAVASITHKSESTTDNNDEMVLKLNPLQKAQMAVDDVIIPFNTANLILPIDPVSPSGKGAIEFHKQQDKLYFNRKYWPMSDRTESLVERAIVRPDDAHIGDGSWMLPFDQYDGQTRPQLLSCHTTIIDYEPQLEATETSHGQSNNIDQSPFDTSSVEMLPPSQFTTSPHSAATAGWDGFGVDVKQSLSESDSLIVARDPLDVQAPPPDTSNDSHYTHLPVVTCPSYNQN